MLSYHWLVDVCMLQSAPQPIQEDTSLKRIANDLASAIEQAVRQAQQAGDLPHFEIPPFKVSRPSRVDHGDYATNAALQIQSVAGMKGQSRAIAEMLMRHLPESDYVDSVDIAGPGFINFRLSDSWLQAQVDLILAEGDRFAQMDDFVGKKAQVECVSANPTGPLTVGRVRGGIIGDTLARLLRSMGYAVELEYYFNNAGAQMRKLGESLQARYCERLGLDFTFPDKGYQGEYIGDLAESLIQDNGDGLKESSWEVFKNFAEEHIFHMIRNSLTRIGIEFDTFFNENTVYEDGSIWNVLEDLSGRGLTYKALAPERDPDADLRPDQDDLDAAATGEATWIRIRQIRDAKKDVALVRSNGEPTYRLPDIAYHVNKMDRGFDLAVNILGADHIEEARDVKAILGALGYDQNRLQHIIHQFVTLTENSKTKRMSTRKGEFVTLDELANEVGADAVRYFLLKHAPNTHMDFDLDLARQQSNENPVYYIQNAHVRCSGIARQADERNLSFALGNVELLTDPAELSLIRKMMELPEVIERSVQELEPHKIAIWAHEELAHSFHQTYEEARAMHSDVPEALALARLKLYAAAKIVLKRTLTLMGMSAPESM